MSQVESAAAVPIRGPQQRSGWTSVRRATVLVLWRAAPWVLVVLVATSLVGIVQSAGLTWSTLQRGRTVITWGGGGVAAFVELLVGVVALLSWARTVHSAVPVLVAGGITRRAAAGGLLVGVVALATVSTGALVVVALAGHAAQRAVLTSFPTPPAPPPGSDAWAAPLTLALDAPTEAFNPVVTFAWLVALALGGALVGAAGYRWGARGVAVVLAAAVVPWAAYLSLVVGMSMDGTIPEGAPSAAGSPLASVAACPVMAVAVWLVLRRAPLRPPAR